MNTSTCSLLTLDFIDGFTHPAPLAQPILRFHPFGKVGGHLSVSHKLTYFLLVLPSNVKLTTGYLMEQISASITAKQNILDWFQTCLVSREVGQVEEGLEVR